MDLTTSIEKLPFIGEVYAKRLGKLAIETINDLLWHVPSRYEDLGLISSIHLVQPGEKVTVKGVIVDLKNTFTRKKTQIQKLQLKDESGEITAMWFNQPFLIKNLKVGQKLALSGIASSESTHLQFISPEYELIKEHKPLIHVGRLVPTYPETTGVSSKWLRSRIYPLVESLNIPEYIPEHILKQYALPQMNEALRAVHFPTTLQEAQMAKQRLAFEEVFIVALHNALKRKEWRSKTIINPLLIDEKAHDAFLKKLPFQLTQAQQRVIAELFTDLTKTNPMNRLLQGDVGSGKTVVAAAVMYMTYLNQGTSLCMAPTQVLAQQHFQTLTTLLTPLKMRVGLQTGASKSVSKKSAKESFDVLVGTHALLQEYVTLPNIRLIVIDEQHRFGVRQRALLRQKANLPHVLTMTATPIPRTMALTLYGDLDLSLLDEMPKGRQPVKTWVVPEAKRIKAYEWIKKQLVERVGETAFIVCPFIEPSETLKSVKSATDEFQKMKAIFAPIPVGLLHGKMKAAKKDEVLDTVRQNQVRILVCTPVVEVGIDIPQATIMMIEAAERFGLSQLHQLRGRVGRNDIPSYCLLFTSSEDAEIARLKHIEKTYEGARLAEIDLRLRGPGSVFGTAQHGRELFKIASFTDYELISQAQAQASQLIHADPELATSPLLKQRLISSTILDVVPD